MNPIRIFEGNAQPHQPFWRFRDAVEADGPEPEMELYGYISEYSWFQDEITPKLFKDELYAKGQGKPITVRINSGGGDMLAASVIRATLVDYPGKVTVRIDGLAASAATYVAMAGDVVRMQDSAYFMIHDPWTVAIGNVDELKKSIDLLKTLKDGIMDTYLSKTSLSREKLSKMMSNETWMTAQEAKDLGFVDEVIAGKGQRAQNSVLVNALRDYANVPAALRGILQQAEQPDNEPLSDQPALNSQQAAPEAPEVARLRAEVKLYV